MEADNKRLQYIDAIKGISMIMIVLCHLLAPCIGRVILMHLECIFLACLFFFAGFSYRTGGVSAAEKIRIKSMALFIPFLRYALILWLAASVYLAAAGKGSVKAAFMCLRNFFAGGLWNSVLISLFHLRYYSLDRNYYILTDLWIFPAMIFACVLFYLTADRVLRSYRKTLIAAAVLFTVTAILCGFGISLPYNLHIAPYWAAFMLLGAFAGRRRLFERIRKEEKWMPGIVSLGLGVTVAMIKQPSADLCRGSFGENEVFSMLLCIAAAIPAIWGLGQLCSLAEESGSGIVGLKWMGQNYLNVFAIHRSLAWLIGLITGISVMYDSSVIGGDIAVSLLIGISVLALCMAPGTLREISSKRKRRAKITAGRRARDESRPEHKSQEDDKIYGIERPLAARRPEQERHVTDLSQGDVSQAKERIVYKDNKKA